MEVRAAARRLVTERFAWVDGHADVWAVFADAGALAAVVEALVEPFAGEQPTAVCGVESRGFLLGGAAAVRLGVGFAAVRKAAGLFPGEKVTRTAVPDYRGNAHLLRLRRASLRPGDRVLLVDDWIETASQALATRELVAACGAELVGTSVIVDQLPGRLRPAVGRVEAILGADELPAAPGH